MTLTELRRRARHAFGPRLEHATPANVQEFLDGLSRERWQEQRTGQAAATGEQPRYDVTENAVSYEQITREFFARTLESGDDDALVGLWLYALGLAYADLEDAAGQQLDALFRDLSPQETQDRDHD